VIENPTIKELDFMRERCLRFSNLLNEKTEVMDAITLVTKLNDQRNLLIDYIMMLESFIKNHHNPEIEDFLGGKSE